MSSPIATPEDLRAAREATQAQRDAELALLAAEARIALDAVEPIVEALPEPARTAVAMLARMVAMMVIA